MKTILAIVVVLLIVGSITAQTGNKVSVIEMDGMIAGGFLSYLEREIDHAVANNHVACLILLNTPGGLVNTTIKLNEAILNAEIPVIVYVYPSGAMAASAGAFVVLASDISAMSSVTTIGSAQPISITPEGAADAGDKTRKFLARQAKSLAEDKGRPVDIANDFVEHNLALTAQEAMDAGVIDVIADSIDDLLNQIDGMEISKRGRTFVINTDSYRLDFRELKRSESIEQFLSDPQIAMLLMMVGLMGLYVGFSSPGTFVPEVLGGIALILGVFGLGLFEINIVGIILLIAGVSLIVAEFFTSGFGILGIGGLIALVLGGLLLPVEPLMGGDWYGTFIRTVIGLGVGIGIILAFVVQRVINSIRNPQTTSINLSYPKTGIVFEDLSPEGMIKAGGELWRAKSSQGLTIAANTKVIIEGKDGHYLLAREDEAEAK